MDSIDEMEDASESEDLDAREEFKDLMETSGMEHGQEIAQYQKKKKESKM